MRESPEKLDFSKLLLSHLDACRVWLDNQSVGAVIMSDGIIACAEELLQNNPVGHANRSALGSSRKAEIELLQLLIDLFSNHLNNEKSTLLPISQALATDYRAKVKHSIDERWLKVPSIETRVAMLSTAASFDPYFLLHAYNYQKALQPHSKHASELRRVVLAICLEKKLGRIPRAIRSSQLAALLIALRRVLDKIRSRERKQHWANEQMRLNNLHQPHDGTYLRTIERLHVGSGLAEISYLSFSLPSMISHGLRAISRGARAAAKRYRLRLQSVANKAASHILINRGYGGIGDITMMSSGLSAMAERGHTVHFGIPEIYKDYASNYFAAKIDVIAVPRLSEIGNYDQIYDFSICPTWGKEVTRLLNTVIPRHILFAQAMRIKSRDIFAMSPISLKKRRFPPQSTAILSVSIQLYSEESYRNLPEMERLANAIARIHGIEVIAICIAHIDSLHPSIKQTSGKALVETVSQIEKTDILICPDSAFLHIGEGLGINTICLAGPTVSPALSAIYKHTRLFRNPAFSECSPCYRSQHTPCKLVGWTGAHSPCLEGDWFHAHIIATISHELDKRTRSTPSRPRA